MKKKRRNKIRISKIIDKSLKKKIVAVNINKNNIKTKDIKMTKGIVIIIKIKVIMIIIRKKDTMTMKIITMTNKMIMIKKLLKKIENIKRNLSKMMKEEISQEMVNPEEEEVITEIKILPIKIETIAIKEKITIIKEVEIEDTMNNKSFSRKDSIKNNLGRMKINRMNKRER
jgi:hypothetical protein